MATQINKLCALGKALGLCSSGEQDLPLRKVAVVHEEDPDNSSQSPVLPTKSIKDFSLRLSSQFASNTIPHPRRVGGGEDV